MDLIYWAGIAFLISLIAGAFGFTGVSERASTLAKVLFGLFLIIAIVLIGLVWLGIKLIT